MGQWPADPGIGPNVFAEIVDAHCVDTVIPPEFAALAQPLATDLDCQRRVEQASFQPPQIVDGQTRRVSTIAALAIYIVFALCPHRCENHAAVRRQPDRLQLGFGGDTDIIVLGAALEVIAAASAHAEAQLAAEDQGLAEERGFLLLVWADIVSREAKIARALKC